MSTTGQWGLLALQHQRFNAREVAWLLMNNQTISEKVFKKSYSKALQATKLRKWIWQIVLVINSLYWCHFQKTEEMSEDQNVVSGRSAREYCHLVGRKSGHFIKRKLCVVLCWDHYGPNWRSTQCWKCITCWVNQISFTCNAFRIGCFSITAFQYLEDSKITIPRFKVPLYNKKAKMNQIFTNHIIL